MVKYTGPNYKFGPQAFFRGHLISWKVSRTSVSLEWSPRSLLMTSGEPGSWLWWPASISFLLLPWSFLSYLPSLAHVGAIAGCWLLLVRGGGHTTRMGAVDETDRFGNTMETDVPLVTPWTEHRDGWGQKPPRWRAWVGSCCRRWLTPGKEPPLG